MKSVVFNGSTGFITRFSFYSASGNSHVEPLLCNGNISADLVKFAVLFWLFFNPRMMTLILIFFLNLVVLSVEQEAYEVHKVMSF